ncbi:MAG: DUF547 domain-containing protein [Myxococcota bacterium]|nr:DUF547 domain-containing protein [Myxococcota bacterium]
MKFCVSLFLVLVSLSCTEQVQFSDGARPSIDAPDEITPNVSGYGYMTLDALLHGIVKGACVDLPSATTNTELQLLFKRMYATLKSTRIADFKNPVELYTFWINAYNFAVLSELKDQFKTNPAVAISDAGFAVLRRPSLQIGDTFFAPDWIAHAIIRGRFDHISLAEAEPDLVHRLRAYHEQIQHLIDGRSILALGCGASSCPTATKAFQASRLEQMLDASAKAFITNPDIGVSTGGVSPLFHWYSGDFSDHGGAAEFIQQVQPGTFVDPRRLLDFDWSVRLYKSDDVRCQAIVEDVAPRMASGQRMTEDIPERVCAIASTRPCGPSARIGQCQPGLETCEADGWSDCVGAIEPASESCNGFDDDCDGEIDEEFDNPGMNICERVGVCASSEISCRDGRFHCEPPADFEMVETRCDGLDNDCDGEVDEGVIAPSTVAGCAQLGQCAGTEPSCQNGLWICAYMASVEDETELSCDGLDNDCDGTIDEALPDCACPPGQQRPCGTDIGQCRVGLQRCIDGQWSDCSGRGPTEEICDAADNDCDGTIDDGVANLCGDCGPAPFEICDNQDNDCDGQVDEGVLNGCGTCGTTPTEVCNGVDDDCDGRTDENVRNACGSCGDAQAESCNGLDDDCDGFVDENLEPPTGIDCPNLGVCAGVTTPGCNGASGFGCLFPPSYEAVEVSCDFRDNDCDGQTDEALLNSCDFCGPDPNEACNHLDDDCDGIEDEGCPFDPSSRPMRDD